MWVCLDGNMCRELSGCTVFSLLAITLIDYLKALTDYLNMCRELSGCTLFSLLAITLIDYRKAISPPLCSLEVKCFLNHGSLYSGSRSQCGFSSSTWPSSFPLLNSQLPK